MEKKGMHRLLVLGTLFELEGIVKKAVERGIYTVVCDGNPDGSARKYASKGYVADVRDIDALAEICRKEKIDHIITSYSDVLFESMVRAADRAGIPCYAVPEQLPAYREKTVCKALCRSLGLRVPDFLEIEEEMLDREPEFSFPAVLKPVDSYGSRGLFVVHSWAEVRDAFADARKYSIGSTHALLETLSKGQELNCQAVLTDGTVHILSIADRMTAAYRPDRVPVNYANIYPSRYTDEVLDKVREIFQRYSEATGRRNGPLAMQCFWDGSEIEIGEIAGRFFGYEHELVTMITGLDLDEVLLDTVYDIPKLASRLAHHDPKGQGVSACLYPTADKKGIVTDQSVLRRLADEPFVRDMVLFFQEGELCDLEVVGSYFVRYYLKAESREEMDRIIAYMLEHMAAYDEHGRNLLLLPKIICHTLKNEYNRKRNEK